MDPTAHQWQAEDAEAVVTVMVIRGRLAVAIQHHHASGGANHDVVAVEGLGEEGRPRSDGGGGQQAAGHHVEQQKDQSGPRAHGTANHPA